MAHELYEIDGRDSMAYTGETPWHGLGQKVDPDATLEQWIREGGFDWEIREAPVEFWSGGSYEFSDKHRVLFRSDNWEPLSVVSNRYKIVQPKQVIEFFRDLVEDTGKMKIETVGSILGGRKFWAMARILHDMSIRDDAVHPYLLLASSCDGSLASVGKQTSKRVVCNNTLNFALGSAGGVVKVFHNTEFDAKKVKLDLGLMEQAIGKEHFLYQDMAKVQLSEAEIVKFFLGLLTYRKGNELTVPYRILRQYYDAYRFGPGAGLSTVSGTLWGALNAVSFCVDHNPNSRDAGTRLNQAWFGGGARRKDLALQQAISIIEKDEFLFDGMDTPDNYDEGMIEEIKAA